MFQLVLSVISIGLVAALAITSIHFGGQAFDQAARRAETVSAQRASAASRHDLPVPRSGYVTVGGH